MKIRFEAWGAAVSDRRGVWCVLIGYLLVAPVSGWAQEAVNARTRGVPLSERTFVVEASAGVFASYPDPFQMQYCNEDAWAAEVGAGYRLTSRIRVHLGATLSQGFGEVECAIPASPAPLPGSRFDRNAYGDDIRGVGFASTRVGTMVELTPRSPSSFRGRVDLLRLWDKSLNAWSVGAGYRFDLGGHRVVLELERWSVSIPFRREHILVGDDNQFIVESAEEMAVSSRPFLFRVGYEVGIG